MKFGLFTAIVASAALTQVDASPLRVVIVTSHSESPTIPNIRFGHALADSHVAKLALPTPHHNNHINTQVGGRRPCGQRIKDKAVQISNAFRHALGLPMIEQGHPQPGDHVHGGMVHIMPFVGTPPPHPYIQPGNHIHGDLYRIEDDKVERHFRMHQLHKWGSTFSMRIHNALMALGPWEGRAVAFVLGCGIGVLVRMFWVLAVVGYRSIRGERDDEYTQVTVIEEYIDAEDIVVPPPTYTVADEKEPIKVKDTRDVAEN